MWVAVVAVACVVKRVRAEEGWRVICRGVRVKERGREEGGKLLCVRRKEGGWRRWCVRVDG